MSTAKEEAFNIMEQIHGEDTTKWPHGLYPDQYNGEGDNIYLIRKSASAGPVGFIGWQESMDAGRKVGYYSIGVLPEYRQQGFAKAAVASLLQEKSASVDEVRAMVMDGNAASIATAKAVGIEPTVVKQAAFNPLSKRWWLKKLLKAKKVPGLSTTASLGKDALIGGTLGAGPLLAEHYASGDAWSAEDLRQLKVDALIGIAGKKVADWTSQGGMRRGKASIADAKKMLKATQKAGGNMTDMRAAKGALHDAHAALDKTKAWHLGKITAIPLIEVPVKNVLLSANSWLKRKDETAEAISKLSDAVSENGKKKVEEVRTIINNVGAEIPMWGKLGLGAAGLGAGYLGWKGLQQSRENAKLMRDVIADKKIEMTAARDAGRIKITLPTRNPGDAETIVDLPIDNFSLSKKILNAKILNDLGRDTRRRLRSGNKERIRHRKTTPETKDAIEV